MSISEAVEAEPGQRSLRGSPQGSDHAAGDSRREPVCGQHSKVQAREVCSEDRNRKGAQDNSYS